jgi:hypothetical protein
MTKRGVGLPQLEKHPPPKWSIENNKLGAKI